MKREIKFRAWDGKKMLYSKCLYPTAYCDRLDMTSEGYHDDWADHNEEVIAMQFTGLKDKNGKEIYEGDILKNNDINWEIYSCDGAYRMRQLVAGKLVKGNWLLMNEPDHSEIIGNIYQNPELIKQ